MKLTPQAYKLLVRVAQCAYDFSMWSESRNSRDGGVKKYKTIFLNKWPAVYHKANREPYSDIFRKALEEIAKGQLDGSYAKTFA